MKLSPEQVIDQLGNRIAKAFDEAREELKPKPAYPKFAVHKNAHGFGFTICKTDDQGQIRYRDMGSFHRSPQFMYNRGPLGRVAFFSSLIYGAEAHAYEYCARLNSEQSS